ncbi:MAG: hypothetical protein N2545_09710 [Thermoflexales bacterium]|nr:hypothetical protein [Thermoflexales bacterium]
MQLPFRLPFRFSARTVLFSATCDAAERAACLPTTLAPQQFQEALGTPHGLFFALVAANTATTNAARLLEQLALGYRLVPPDVERRLALRAALNYAEVGPEFDGALAIGALVNHTLHLLGVGSARAFHVDENGRLLALRLASAAQQPFAASDVLLLLGGQLVGAFDPYELALMLYAHDAEDAGRRLLTLAQRRSTTGALMVLKPEHRRSALRSLRDMLRPA